MKNIGGVLTTKASHHDVCTISRRSTACVIELDSDDLVKRFWGFLTDLGLVDSNVGGGGVWKLIV